MIRPFDLRDIPLLHRLEANGIILDSRTAYTHAHRPFRDALLAYLITGRGTPTFITNFKNMHGFGQLRIDICDDANNRRGRLKFARASLVALGGYPKDREEAFWTLLLDELTAQAGRLGAAVLLSEADESSHILEHLRQADFSVYARQEVWRLDRPLEAQPSRLTRPVTRQDRWSIQQLVTKTEPILVQQVEPIRYSSAGLVCEKDGQMLVYICIFPGSQGTWVELYVQPQGEELMRSIIPDVAAILKPSRQAPLYFRIRRYQRWLDLPLTELGFEPVGTQAVLVRHIAVRVAEMQLSPLTVPEKGLEATSPMIHTVIKPKN